MPYDPIVKNTAYRTFISLRDSAGYKANPTIAAGDFKVSKDGGAFANLTTTPSVAPAAGVMVQIDFSSDEMNADNVALVCIDQTDPKEWQDFVMVIQTAAGDPLTAIAALNDLSSADVTAAVPTVLEIQSGLATASALATVDGLVDNIIADTNELQTDWTNGGRLDLILDVIAADTTTDIPASIATLQTYVDTEVGTLVTEMAKVPKSDSTVTWNATALASINAEVDTALNTAIPGSPTANSVNERIATMDGLLLGTVAAGTHVAQSGDSYARLGLPAGASVSADIAAIEAQTDDIGAAGAGLTGLPWNAAWDAEVQSEVADALAVYDPPTNAEMEARTLVAATYFDPAADTVAHVTLVDTTTTNTDMRGTDGAALASEYTSTRAGYLDELAAANLPADIADLPTNAELASALTDMALDSTVMKAADYVAPDNAGITAIGTIADKLDTALVDDGAVYQFTANALELAPTGGSAPTVEQIRTEMDTNSTKLASILEDTGTTLDALIKDVPTVAEFEARTIPAATYFDPAADVVAHVTLVDTTTTNTDMRGTDNAALDATVMKAASYTAPDNASITAILEDTGTTLDALIKDIPTNAELETALTDMALNSTVAKDATVMKAADYIAPDNDGIAAIETIADKLDTALELDGAVYRYTVNALELAPTGGSAPTVEQIRAEIDSNSTQLAAIVEDTGTTIPAQIGGLNNISTADVTGAAPTVLQIQSGLATSAEIAALNNISTTDISDAIAAAEPIEANIKQVNDVTITGTGTVGSDEWRKA